MSFATSLTSKNAKKYRIVFLGDMAVGKTSVIQKFTTGRFDEGLNPTVGIDFNKRDLTIGEQTYRLQMWDTAGQERYHSLIPTYLKNSHLAFLIFDLTKTKTLENIEKWYKMLRQHENAPCIIVGNKADLTVARKVSRKQAESFAEKLGLTYIEISAKTGKKVDQLFLTGVDKILQKQRIDKKSSSDSNAETAETMVKDRTITIDGKMTDDGERQQIKKKTCCKG